MQFAQNQKYLLHTVFIVLFTAILPLFGQSAVPLTQGWKFHWGDSARFAQPDYNDGTWDTIAVNRWWNDQGYPKKAGFAWYRIHVVIPSTLKQSAYLKDSLVFHLGKIDDFDQVYLNGHLIGENNHAVPPNAVPTDTFATRKHSLWDVPRRYALAVTDPRIHWDAENVIAIRVYNWGGPGGIYSGDLRIAMADILEYLQVTYNPGVFQKTASGWEKQVVFRNRSRKYPMQGTLRLAVRDNVAEKTLRTETHPIELAPGDVQEMQFRFRERSHSTTVRYVVQLEHSQQQFQFAEGIPYILTPPHSRAPALNLPYVYGQRPGHPFIFRIPASGARPMVFSAHGLPPGISLDARNGILRGKVLQRGTYRVRVTVRNRYGSASHTYRLVIGDTLALTPPMGWNSWNVWGLAVTQDRVQAAARAFVKYHLADFGWQFVNVDDGWEILGNGTQPGRAPNGEILTNAKFPDMKALGDSIHALGLKFGIYSSPGPLTCGGYTGSYQHEDQDARTFARWGVDYLKYDLCHYRDLMNDVNDPAELIPPYARMGRALRRISRDIVYSICEYGNGKVWEWGARVDGNLWRTTGDIWDTWERMAEIGFQQDKTAPYAGPGHWNDPDMLIIGWLGWGNNLHYTRLTPDEQYTHISLWALLSAPLLLGCDLERLDAFTLNLITNPEIIAIDQDALGYQARTVWEQDSVRAYLKKLADGNLAVGLFNLASQTRKVVFPLRVAGIQQEVEVRDVWRRQTVGRAQQEISATIPPHGVYLVKLLKPRK